MELDETNTSSAEEITTTSKTAESEGVIGVCKKCSLRVRYIACEGLQCSECGSFVHATCLSRGSTPGGLVGDVFFQYRCEDCSPTGSEHFVRDKMPWLQALVVVFYHMQTRNSGIAKKGYFHWKNHIATFIDKHWNTLFPRDFKRKKTWTGTVSGILSHFSPHFFYSGTAIFKEQGWWTLTYPKLTPYVIIQLNAEFVNEKQKAKNKKLFVNDFELVQSMLSSKPYITPDLLQAPKIIASAELMEQPVLKFGDNANGNTNALIEGRKRRRSPSPQHFEFIAAQKSDFQKESKVFRILETSSNCEVTNKLQTHPKIALQGNVKKFLDPLCYYNTSLNNVKDPEKILSARKARITCSIRESPLLSPYSGSQVPPYIYRDCKIVTPWMRLMAEVQAKVNGSVPNWKMPPRAPLDFCYVQPEHIPAINSLCNHFFWHGIDLTEALNYPEFSCVVMYRKLVVAFAFVVPDVKANECYISFIFTRPGWRNSGIAKRVLYHLIQTSIGRDITLHVSISNSALFLYQKFGFKVEYVVVDFYDRYLSEGSIESKNAFFCRLDR